MFWALQHHRESETKKSARSGDVKEAKKMDVHAKEVEQLGDRLGLEDGSPLGLDDIVDGGEDVLADPSSARLVTLRSDAERVRGSIDALNSVVL